MLALRSDAYALREDYGVQLAPEREEPPVVDFDPDVYKARRRLRRLWGT